MALIALGNLNRFRKENNLPYKDKPGSSVLYVCIKMFPASAQYCSTSVYDKSIIKTTKTLSLLIKETVLTTEQFGIGMNQTIKCSSHS